MKFPYSNFHDLNTDWIIRKIRELTAKVEAIGSGGGGGGTSDFNQLSNRPSYNSVTMTNATNVPLVKTAVWDGKQDALVSGTNIKTVNNNSLLGSGNITISGGGGTSDFDQLTNRPSYNSVTMDSTTNIPEVKTATWDGKQDALVSGTNIKTINNTSILGSGDISISAGTSDFNSLSNRPSYNGTTMSSTTAIPEVKTATWDGKQDALVSGTNIKTINNTSLLGSGNISISGSGAWTLAGISTSSEKETITYPADATELYLLGVKTASPYVSYSLLVPISLFSAVTIITVGGYGNGSSDTGLCNVNHDGTARTIEFRNFKYAGSNATSNIYVYYR